MVVRCVLCGVALRCVCVTFRCVALRVALRVPLRVALRVAFRCVWCCVPFRVALRCVLRCVVVVCCSLRDGAEMEHKANTHIRKVSKKART